MSELYYPELLRNKEAFPANIHFTFYERSSTKASEMKDQIHLYMPEQFGQPSTITWDSSFRGGQAVLGAVGGISSWIADKFANQGMKNMAQRINGVAQNGIPSQDLAELGMGMIPNPYLAQLFRDIDFRNFQYTFRFVPFTTADCDNIKKIITTFRKWSLPSGPQGGAGSPYLNYPGEVDVQYQFMDGENKYIHRFKRSVITGIDIDYTGAGMWTMMRNGFPTETVMNIKLSEIQIVVREDVEEQGY